MICFSTYLSPDAKPASGPVSGVMKPMLMVPLADAGPRALEPELQAARRPPAPTANVPAPMPFSRERREIG